MDRIETYRRIIRNVLSEYVRLQYANAEIQNEAVFDRDNDRYLIVSLGWQDVKRIHGALIHVDIIDDKVWIQRDGTEHGIANDLVAAGIPKDHIVLGFQAPDVRQYTEYAIT
ncbi:MAG: XisI protein [Blastocatellia bacterium]|nr:XisI protein [Blastocatellia bacterium]